MNNVGLHKRIALRSLQVSGTSPPAIMLCFMLLTAAMSMWISNAATTAMMVPILEVRSHSTVQYTETSVDRLY